MKTEIKGGQLFWGTFLLCGGLLFLGVKSDFLSNDWSFIWDIWPVALILLGVTIIFKNTIMKPVLSIGFGAFTAVIVFGIILDVSYDDFGDGYHRDYSENRKVLSADMEDQINFAQLTVSTGASKIVLRDETSELVKIDAKGFLSDYYLRKEISDSSAEIEVGLVDRDYNLFEHDGSNRLELKLNRDPEWSLFFNTGASDSYIDISNFLVRKVKLHTGASNTSFVIGDKLPLIDVKVNMGAAALKFKIPEDSGCRLEGNMVLFAKDLDGFEKIGDNYYSTPGYEEKENKINIYIEGGVSALDIIRY